MTDFKFPTDVKGWLTEGEGRALWELARERDVLEIGSYQGRSTICMAQSAKLVVSVDWHKGDATSGHADTYPAFRSNLERYGVWDRVIALVQRHESFWPAYKLTPFDLVFIDGSHDQFSVQRDVENARKVVRPGGVIALHDMQDVWPHVSHLLPPWFGVVDSLAWFEV